MPTSLSEVLFNSNYPNATADKYYSLLTTLLQFREGDQPVNLYGNNAQPFGIQDLSLRPKSERLFHIRQAIGSSPSGTHIAE